MNLNKVFLIGNLTRDPELRTMPNGNVVANFGLATNRAWKDKTGAQQKQAEFHNIVMFGRLAEIAKQYLQKGSMVMVEGRLQTRSWEGQDGQKRNRTPGTANPKQEEPPEQLATVEYPEDEIKPDEIPF